MATMTIRMDDKNAEAIWNLAAFEGRTLSDSAQAALLERAEDYLTFRNYAQQWQRILAYTHDQSSDCSIRYWPPEGRSPCISISELLSSQPLA